MKRTFVPCFLLLFVVLFGLHCSDSTSGTTPGGLDGGDESGVTGPADTTAPVFAGVKSATSLGESAIAVAWDPATDNTTPGAILAYRVYLAPTSGTFDFRAPVMTTPAGASSTVVSSLAAATAYKVAVRAVDVAGNEDGNKAEATATTTDVTAPHFGGAREARGSGAHELTVEWDAANDNGTKPADITYRVFIATTPGAEDFTAAAATSAPGATSAVVSALDESKTYYVVVHAVDASGNEEKNRHEVTATTLDKTPPTFAGVETAAAQGTSIRITWNAASDSIDQDNVTYDVYMGQGAATPAFTTPLATTLAGARSYTATNLTVSTLYSFVVRARDTSGNQDTNTKVKSATTAASPDITPPTFAGLTSATATGARTIDLAWTAATDDLTAAANIVYDVYLAPTSGSQGFASPSFTTAPGVTKTTLTNLQPLTTTYAVVRARDQAGNADTNTVEKSARTLADTTPPTFNGLASATATSPTSITLAWTQASDDVTPGLNITYRVFQATTAGDESYASPTLTTGPGATSAVISGLVPQTGYYFVVRAVDAAGNVDGNALERSATTPADTVPPTFAGVEALVTQGPTSLLATWSAANDAVAPASAIVYLPYLATTPGGEAFGAAPTPTAAGATSYLFTGLVPNTKYYVVVRARDTYGNVDTNVNEKSATTLADTTAPAFAGASGVSGASTSQLTLSWAAATDNVTPASAIKYRICVTQVAGGCSGASFTATTTVTGAVTRAFTGLTPLTTYYFVVRAEDAAGNVDGNSAERSGQTTADTQPPTFAGLTSATATGPTTLSLAWSAATDNVSTSAQIVYDVYRATSAGGEAFGSPSYTTAAGATSYAVTGLVPSTPYYFVVRARDTAGNAETNVVERSASTQADTTPPTFGGVTSVTALGLTSLRAAWNPATDNVTPSSAIAYLVCWSTGTACQTAFTAMATTADGASSFDITGLAAGTSYTVVVRARDDASQVDANTTAITKSTVADTTAPTFAGASGVSGATATSLTVNWNAAVDNYSPASGITYLICRSLTAGGCASSFVATAQVTNQTSYQFTALAPTSTYYFLVRARDAANNTDTNSVEVSGLTVNDTTAPTFAGIASATPKPGSATVITLGWAAATDNSNTSAQIVYDVYRATTSGGQSFAAPTYTTSSGATSFDATGLAAQTPYYFVVRARDTAGNRDANVVQKSATTNADVTAPTFAGITGLTATPGFATRLDASWSAATDDSATPAQVAYRVCWSVGSSCVSSFVTMATTATGATGYTVQGLAPSTAYTVVVRAVDPAGNASSNTQSITTSTTADVTAPTFGGATSAGAPASSPHTARTVSWSALATDDATASSAMSYDVCVTQSSGGCNGGAFAVYQTVSGSVTSATVTGLTPNTLYYFVVRARDGAGNRDGNSVQVASTTAQEPNPPTAATGLSVIVASDVALTVQWQAAIDDYSGPSQITYDLYESNASGSLGSLVASNIAGTSGTNAYPRTSRLPSTLYCYTVRSRDAALNYGANSAQACGTTLADQPPTTPATTSATGNYRGITFSWSAATDNVTATSALRYDVCYSATSGGCNSFVANGGTTAAGVVSYTLPLAPSTAAQIRYFSVRTRDGANNVSAATAQRVGTTTADTTPPTAPTNVQVLTYKPLATYLQVTWTAASDAVTTTPTYELCWATTTSCLSSFTAMATASGVSTYIGSNALTPRTKYYVYIRSVDEAGNRSGLATDGAPQNTATSYSANVLPLLTNNCNGCHDGSYVPGPFSRTFFLTTKRMSGGSGYSYGALPCGTARYYVYQSTPGTFPDPGVPTSSLLYQKVHNTAGCGTSMPPGPAFPTDDQDIFSQWILEGGQNN